MFQAHKSSTMHERWVHQRSVGGGGSHAGEQPRAPRRAGRAAPHRAAGARPGRRLQEVQQYQK